MLNKEDAAILFYKKAFTFGGADGVPVFVAMDLLGENAVKFGMSEAGTTHNSFYINGDSVTYLYWKGFIKAVGFANAEKLIAKKPA